VEVLEVGRDVRGAELQRITQHDAAVHHLDRQDLDGAAWSGTPLLLYLALDERAEIPSPVCLLRGDDPRTRQANPPDDRAALPQLAEAVAERDIVDRDDRLAVPRQV